MLIHDNRLGVGKLIQGHPSGPKGELVPVTVCSWQARYELQDLGLVRAELRRRQWCSTLRLHNHGAPVQESDIRSWISSWGVLRPHYCRAQDGANPSE